ncbi:MULTISPECIES: flagellar biosynthesis protein FlhB [Anoxybacillus]|uniref:Flagellar biosynthesis protein FlhB n=1 Tax=Anoxybacillus gonensis TaxID=198467 RepID=A0AAW7TI96_9BACL|nr:MULTISPECIES: flagellar biosynthesis protein FlhB [Anoxybacillus]MBW9218583.1 flagellar biosynthesis protein FlhB [Anoxybacillus sp. ST70]MCX8047599.1 flagellar biosynthesis protein FlhB [Anoxybacillus gonensis]MDO0877972.1 flagellar biosynthesis protein FlhB [Anoxybacillus gonensis]
MNGNHYFTAISSYEQKSGSFSVNVSTMDILTNYPYVQKDEELAKNLMDPEYRMPVQLYAAIGEVLKLIRAIERS